MIEHSFLIKGILLGFAIAAAIGPIAILCIHKTLVYGRLSGFCSGLGAAFADTIYGAIAALGLTFISDFLILEAFWLKLIGGAFLIFLGDRTFFAKPIEKIHAVTHKTLIHDFITTFFLTLVNPLTILSFVAIFAALGLANTKGDYSDAWDLVLGVFIGSILWWLILSEGVALFRKQISNTMMTWINRCSGIIIALVGIIAWASLILNRQLAQSRSL